MIKKTLIVSTILGTSLTLSANSASAGGASSIEQEIANLKKKIEILSEKIDDRKSSVNAKNISFASSDGSFKADFGGKIQIDTAFFNDDIGDNPDSTRIRRAELQLSGKYNDWGYKFKINTSGDSSPIIDDAYLQYKLSKTSSIQLGQFKEPIVMDYLTSSSDTLFMERATVKDAFSPGRSVGLAYKYHTDNLLINAGVFGNNTDTASSDDEGYALTARAVYSNDFDGNLLHIGAAGSYRSPDQATKTARFRSRPETSFGNRLVDTGSISNVDETVIYGLELAAQNGPLSFQSEYLISDTETSTTDYNFNGYYAQISYIFTGETKSYKSSKGTFTKVKPESEFSRNGGTGAWEAALRYSGLDLNDNSISGGELQNYTLGLNWYPNEKVRLMANYIITDTDDDNPTTSDESPQIFSLRAAMDF